MEPTITLCDDFNRNSSFFGYHIKTSYNKLVSILGLPNCKSGDYKVSHIWQCCLFSDDVEKLFEIYDWKYDFDPKTRPDEEIEWNMSGSLPYEIYDAFAKFGIKVYQD